MNRARASVASLALLACGGEGARLRVDVATNYVPRLEFSRVEVSFEDGPRLESEASTWSPRQWFDGVRVGGLDDAPNQTRFSVRLMQGEDVLAERTVSARVRRGAIVRVLLSRDCLGVSCPAAGDSPDAVACLGGTCVPEDCVDGTEPSCPTPVCGDDEGCGSLPTPACATAVCFAGSCAALSDCSEGNLCDFSVGECVAGDEPMDGGRAPDGGTDAGDLDSGLEDAGLDGGTDAGMACVSDTSDVLAWYPFATDDPLADAVGSTPLGRASGDVAPLCTGGPVSTCESSLTFSGCLASYLIATGTSTLAIPSGSFDFFLRLDASPVEEGIVCRDRGDPGGHICLWRTADDLLVLRQQQSSGQFAIRCAGPLPRGEWVPVGVNFGEGGLELWAGGVLGDLDQEVRIVTTDFTCGSGDVRTALDTEVDLVVGASNANMTIDLQARNLSIGSLRFSRVPRRYD